MSAGLSSDKSVREAYEADASGLHMVPDLVARPDSVDEVLEVMHRATTDRIAVTCAGAQEHNRGLYHRQGNSDVTPFARQDFRCR